MPALPDYVSSQDRIILFDGVCVLCTGWAKFLLKHDKQAQFKLASVQSPAGQDLLRYADMPLETYSTLVVIDCGEVLVRSDAILTVLKTLGMPWALSAVFKIIPRSLRDFIYNPIAANRYRLFGQRQSCYLPSVEDKARFLLAPEN